MYLEVTSSLGATMQPKELVKCMGTCINVIHSTVAREVTVGENYYQLTSIQVIHCHNVVSTLEQLAEHGGSS